MMEAMRILKKFYPNPKRTIMVGHWGSEEQGLNGSRAFVEDYPKIVENTQAVFNQDNGTGRVVNLSGQGFLHSYEYISNWLSAVPQNKHIETDCECLVAEDLIMLPLLRQEFQHLAKFMLVLF